MPQEIFIPQGGLGSYMGPGGIPFPLTNPLKIRTAGIQIPAGSFIRLSDIAQLKALVGGSHIIIQHVAGTVPIRVGSPGDIIFQDNFSAYVPGNLVGQGPWVNEAFSYMNGVFIKPSASFGGINTAQLVAIPYVTGGGCGVTAPFAVQAATTPIILQFALLWKSFATINNFVNLGIGLGDPLQGNPPPSNGDFINPVMAVNGLSCAENYLCGAGGGALPGFIVPGVVHHYLLFLDGVGTATIFIDGVVNSVWAYTPTQLSKITLAFQNPMLDFIQSGSWEIGNLLVQNGLISSDGLPFADGQSRDFYNEQFPTDLSQVAIYSDGPNGGGNSDVFIFVRGL